MQLNALAMATSALLAFGSTPLHAQTWQMPPDNQRCPSKWGAADQRGSANMMKPESVLRAAKLIKTGEMFELAAVLSPDPKEPSSTPTASSTSTPNLRCRCRMPVWPTKS
jgi:hypothetical protein